MGPCYRHLTEADRIVIRTLLQQGKTRQSIADFIERDLSTVKREIRRNSGLRGYRPKQAQQKAAERRQKPRTRKMTPEVVKHIEAKLGEDYSPEQISATMAKAIGVKVSHECIYQHIWQDKRDEGTLYRHLRIANGQKRRKRYGKKDWRGRIPDRVGIEDRPKIVDSRRRFGDWEADLVCGAHHKGFLITLVERKSRFTVIGHVKKKTAEALKNEIIALLWAWRDLVRTITYDNGREFCGHSDINQALGCRSYFAAPYHSWERGLNENTNGLIRQYFPKNSDLRKVARDDIDFVMNRLNARPRKVMDFKTPSEVLSRAS